MRRRRKNGRSSRPEIKQGHSSPLRWSLGRVKGIGSDSGAGACKGQGGGQFFLHRAHSCGRRFITEAERMGAQTSAGWGWRGSAGPTSWLAVCVWREALPQA